VKPTNDALSARNRRDGRPSAPVQMLPVVLAVSASGWPGHPCSLHRRTRIIRSLTAKPTDPGIRGGDAVELCAADHERFRTIKDRLWVKGSRAQLGVLPEGAKLIYQAAATEAQPRRWSTRNHVHPPLHNSVTSNEPSNAMSYQARSRFRTTRSRTRSGGHARAGRTGGWWWAVRACSSESVGVMVSCRSQAAWYRPLFRAVSYAPCLTRS